jgi:predicted nucleotidyltransferase component of viral defense system
MINFIPYLAKRFEIENRALLEKDVILHRILHRLMQTSFKEEYVFKGGTCLTKCYLGYYRFSEDLDFTYIDQKEFDGLSQKAIRKILSSKINEILEKLVVISKELGLDFNQDKSDSKYVMLGGNNKFITFKLWYKSIINNQNTFIKIQINYVELILNKIVDNKAKSIITMPEEEIKLLYPDYIDTIKEIKLKSYSLDEILLEKIRAILTRRGTKSRDYIDVFLIKKKINPNIKKNEKDIIAKIEFMLRYDKYLGNLSVIKPENLVLADEELLLLKPLDKGFKDFVFDFFKYLSELEDKLIKRNK